MKKREEEVTIAQNDSNEKSKTYTKKYEYVKDEDMREPDLAGYRIEQIRNK